MLNLKSLQQGLHTSAPLSNLLLSCGPICLFYFYPRWTLLRGTFINSDGRNLNLYPNEINLKLLLLAPLGQSKAAVSIKSALLVFDQSGFQPRPFTPRAAGAWRALNVWGSVLLFLEPLLSSASPSRLPPRSLACPDC